MSPNSTRPRPSHLHLVNLGLERERRNTAARAAIAESRARVSRREGDLRRARQARLLADRAASQPYLVAA